MLSLWIESALDFLLADRLVTKFIHGNLSGTERAKSKEPSLNHLVIAAFVQLACMGACVAQQLPASTPISFQPPLQAGLPVPNGTTPNIAFVPWLPALSAGPGVPRGTPVFAGYTP